MEEKKEESKETLKILLEKNCISASIRQLIITAFENNETIINLNSRKLRDEEVEDLSRIILRYLPYVEHIYLENNRLRKIPWGLADLTNLKSIHLIGNSISEIGEIPEWIRESIQITQTENKVELITSKI